MLSVELQIKKYQLLNNKYSWDDGIAVWNKIQRKREKKGMKKRMEENWLYFPLSMKLMLMLKNGIKYNKYTCKVFLKIMFSKVRLFKY